MKKQEDISNSTSNIVESKFHKQKKFRPVTLLVVIVNLEILFQSLIGFFHLPIFFQTIVWGEVETYIKSSTLEVEEVGYKLGSLVGSNMEWNFMFREYMNDK